MNNTVNHEFSEAFIALDDKYKNLDIKESRDMTMNEMKTLVDHIVNFKETGKESRYDAIMDSIYLAYKMGYSRK